MTEITGSMGMCPKGHYHFQKFVIPFLLTPDGHIARYLYGLEYPEKTLRLGLVEASEGRVGTSLDRLVLYCFHYDSSEGRYAPIVARIMQLGGGASLAIFAGFLTILIRRDKKRTLVESTAQ